MEQDSSLAGGVLALIVVLYVAVIGFFIWIYVRIIRKAGYSGWWALMGFVPIGNIVMICLFAFKEWPIRRELHYLRGYAAATGLPGYAPQPPYPYGPGMPPAGQPGSLPPSAPGSWGDQGSWGQQPPARGDQPDGPDDGPPQR